MAKIAVLLPRAFMMEQTRKAARQEKLDIMEVRHIETETTLETAREVIEKGAQIIVARGFQAGLIKRQINIPVVEIELSAQEMGILITKAKRIVQKENPRIAVIGFRNMFCDMTHFDELFEVRLACYFADTFDQLASLAQQAVIEGADVVLGGDAVNKAMEEFRIPSLFLDSNMDSIKNALLVAGKMGEAIDIERSSTAQFETIMDTAFNGIIKIDVTRKIIIINRFMEEVLGKAVVDVVGKSLEEELADIDSEAIDQILCGASDIYASTIQVRKHLLCFLVAPIQSHGEIMGAIISCNKMKIASRSAAGSNDPTYHGYLAAYDFSSLKSEAPVMKDCIRQGKKYAASKYPILLKGEEGTEKELLAQCIHNHSARKNAPFAAISISGLSDAQQYEYLFGNDDIPGRSSSHREEKKGLFRACNHGTLFIEEIDQLSLRCQQKICRSILVMDELLEELSINKIYDVRVIAGTKKELGYLCRKGIFRDDLFYCLNALKISIPPIRDRKQDIEAAVRRKLKAFTRQHTNYLTISEEALQVICNFSWQGNWIQLDYFCERLFLTTNKRKIEAVNVVELQEELYPDIEMAAEEERMVVYRHPEAGEISRLLEECGGNRSLAAQKLNISTTTLWRKMKKYGIGNKWKTVK